ncbi:MAG: hypothetical protein WCG99_01680 [Candidatus Berkelbacteria bacterium]
MGDNEDELQSLGEEQRIFEAQQDEAARLAASTREAELRADHIAHVAAASHSDLRKAAVERDAEMRATGLAEIRETLGSPEGVQEKADVLRSEFDASLLEIAELRQSIARIREFVPEGRPMSPVLATKIEAIEQRRAGIENGLGALLQKSDEAKSLAENVKSYDRLKTEIDLLRQGTDEIYAMPGVADILYQEAIDTDEKETWAVEAGKQERRIAREQALAIEKETAQAAEKEKSLKEEIIKKISDRASRIPTNTGTEKDPRRVEFTEPLISAFLDDALEQSGINGIELTAASADRRRELIRAVAQQIEFGLNTRWNGQDYPNGFGSDPSEAKRVYAQSDPKNFGRQLGNMLGTQMHEAGSPDVLGHVIGSDSGVRVREARKWHRSIPFIVGFARGTQEVRSATKIQEQPYRLVDAHASQALFGGLASRVRLGEMVFRDNIARSAFEQGVTRSEQIYQRAHSVDANEQVAAEK